MTTTGHAIAPPVNRDVAERLDEVAALLEQQGAGPFRVRAYRNAAATIRTLPRAVSDIFDAEGMEGLDAIPTVGP